MKPLSLMLLVAFLSNSLVVDAQVEKTETILVNGTARTFIVHMPKSYSHNSKAAVIFLFHGGGGTPKSILNASRDVDFKVISERDTIILIAPEGIDKSWNDGRITKANRKNIDDVKFIALLADYVQKNYAVDPNRFYAAGISNGGFMVSRLGCEMANRFAAIAIVAATMGEEIPFSTCSPNARLSVMYIHGTADPIIHFEGDVKSIGAEGAFVSHQQVIEKWVALNKCTSTPVVTELPNSTRDATTVTKRLYSCGDAEVVSFVVNNGGHTWPGGIQYLPKMLVGRVSRDMNACEVMCEFFKKHRR